MPFFEDLTKKYGIAWSYEEKHNGILSPSRSYVGYITTPIRILALKPKYSEIGFEHIIRMYLYVYGYRPTDSAAILDVSNAETNADVAALFIKNLKRNIQEGILRTYKRERVKTGTLKGRVDYTKSYRDALMQKRKPVTARISSLSVDNTFNALILTALTKLTHVKKYASSAAELSMYFEGASRNVKKGREVLESINFNSNIARYRRTLTYAAMIIDQLSYSDCGSAAGTDSFLINFDRLFEDFVIKILKEIPEKKEFTTWTRGKKFADVSGSFGVYETREYHPDLIYRFKDEDEKYDYSPSAYSVLDVKNKAYSQFKNADVYQILTYARLLHSKKAVLLYPAFYHRRPEQLLLDPMIFDPASITSCFVNIADEDGEAFLRSIRRFADDVVKVMQE